MRTLIAGGLGYVGSAACELYKSRSEHKVIVVDKRFVPERVAQFPAHFRFIQGDVGDRDLMRRLLPEVDLVLLLAAEVEAERSINKEQAVWENNFEMPKRLIEMCPPSVKIMFPSTGNVFGGLDPADKFLDLTEGDEPKPKYPYAEAKHAIERLLLDHGKNFVILRFGTNYGFAPGIRFNLVTNIFTRRMLLGEDLVIHGGGENWRPSACVWDCARALVFLSRRSEAPGEIFHVVRESYPIKELARRIVALGDGESQLRFIAKDVPFSSYGLSSDKIKRLGFRFEWDLEKAVRQMLKLFRSMSLLQPEVAAD